MKSKYWIAFSSMEQIDSRFIQRLYNYFGDIELAFNATLSDLSQIDGLNIKKVETFIDLRNKTNPDKVLEQVTPLRRFMRRLYYAYFGRVRIIF